MERNLWDQVVLLRFRITKLEQDIELRDEMIALLREKRQPAFKAARGPTLVEVCRLPSCRVRVEEGRAYCSHRCSKKHYWELKKGVSHADNAKLAD